MDVQRMSSNNFGRSHEKKFPHHYLESITVIILPLQMTLTYRNLQQHFHHYLGKWEYPQKDRQNHSMSR